MKYLKKYNNFLVESITINNDDSASLKSAKEKINSFEKDIQEFNQKKSQLSTVVNNSDPDKDISSDIEKIVGKGEERNKLLGQYLTILNIRKNIIKQSDRLSYYTDIKKQAIANKANANKLSGDEKKQQLEKLNDQIKDAEENYKSMKDKIIENEKELKEKEKELDNWIKETKEEFNKLIKELEKNTD